MKLLDYLASYQARAKCWPSAICAGAACFASAFLASSAGSNPCIAANASH